MLIHGNCKYRKNTPTYQTWVSMRQRCTNPHSPDYPNYGGRGVTICKEWEELGANYYTLARYVRLHGIEQALEFYGSKGAL